MIISSLSRLAQWLLKTISMQWIDMKATVYKGPPYARIHVQGYRCGRPHTQRPPLCRDTLQDCSHYDGTFVEVQYF